MERRGQGAIEYILMLGAALVIGLVALALLRSSYDVTPEVYQAESKLYWSTQAFPLRVLEASYADVLCVGSSTPSAGGLRLTLKNSDSRALLLKGIRINGTARTFCLPGQNSSYNLSIAPGKELLVNVQYNTSCDPKKIMDLDLSMVYDKNEIQNRVQQGEKRLVIQCTNYTLLQNVNITSTSLPDGNEDDAYYAELSANGGRPPYSWSASGLPSGLSLSSSGIVTGTPAIGTFGSHDITVTVLDTLGIEDVQLVQITIVPIIFVDPLQITTTSIPNGNVSVAYSTTMAASDGVPPYNWSASNLPTGLSITASTGAISGTPTTAGSYTPTIMVTDTEGDNDTRQFSFNITAQPVTITTTYLPNGTVGTAYSSTVSATNGTAPYNWSATGLPAGLSIATSTGAVSGTPTTSSVYTPTVTVTDALGMNNSRQFSVNISIDPVQITTTSVAAGAYNVSYNQSVSSTGGTSPYSWSASSLPPGLAISGTGSTAYITGIPNVKNGGEYAVTVNVTATQGGSDTQALAICIQGQLTFCVEEPPIE